MIMNCMSLQLVSSMFTITLSTLMLLLLTFPIIHSFMLTTVMCINVIVSQNKVNIVLLTSTWYCSIDDHLSAGQFNKAIWQPLSTKLSPLSVNYSKIPIAGEEWFVTSLAFLQSTSVATCSSWQPLSPHHLGERQSLIYLLHSFPSPKTQSHDTSNLALHKIKSTGLLT